MTPEDVETRLRSLQPPFPPARLRERCLTPRPSTWRPRIAPALAASILVLGLTGWLLFTPAEPVKNPGRIAGEPVSQSLSRPEDPNLQAKIDALFRKNPGKAILVVRLFELKSGAFVPVTKGTRLQILLEPAEMAPQKGPRGPEASVDPDGTLLFVAAPGKYRGRGFRGEHDELRDSNFCWEYGDLDLLPGDIRHLSDAVIAPWMEWTGPDEGSQVSLKSNPAIGWKPYAGVRTVRVELERVTPGSDAHDHGETLGSLKCDCPKDNRIPLSELSKAVRSPLRAGDVLEVTLEGFDCDGKKLSACKTGRRFTLRD